MAAAIVSAYSNIPFAHIQAGELSGQIDGQARHAIGKFAHLHFASNKDAEKRLLKLGEQKFREIELTGTKFTSIMRAEIFMVPIILFTSFVL